MTSRQVRFFVISGDRRVNEFMKGFDLREDMKAFATMRTLVLTGTATNQEMFDLLKAGLEKDFWLVYLLCEFQPDLVYRDERVKVVSDGRKFFLLDDYLRSQGYPHESLRATETTTDS